MKKMKKLASLVLALVMVVAMAMPAFAQTKTVAGDGKATITINNPAKGETYTLYKLFDATVTDDGKIAYQAETIPTDLEAFFELDAVKNVIPKGDIVVKDDEGNVTDTQMTDELKAALAKWAETATPVTNEISDGSTLNFTGLPYGYYVVTVTDVDGETTKSAITVTSTQPNASIYDKNVNEPSVNKEVEKKSYSIGDTIKYTATFDTSNYLGEGENSKQVVEYVISDTLPEFLDNVNVESITIGGNPAETQQFDANKTITITWATKEEDGNSYTSLYPQGAQIVIVYTATLTRTTNINADDTNTITIKANVDNGNGGKEPWDEEWKDSEKIRTYAAAIKKVDQDKKALAGAEFTIKGLTVEKVADGIYRVVSYNPESDTESDALATDTEGKLYIVGLANDVKLIVTEFKAPDGYNKLTDTEELSVQVLEEIIYETSGERYYDEDGNLVSESIEGTTTKTVENNLSTLDVKALEIVNNQGTLLPSTGGIGTTIFYVVGTILVLGAGILLVTKRRMKAQ